MNASADDTGEPPPTGAAVAAAATATGRAGPATGGAALSLSLSPSRTPSLSPGAACAMDDGAGGVPASPTHAQQLQQMLLGNAAANAQRDCNCNASACSFGSDSASLPDADFVQDAQDYQWFLDYGYREGGGPQPGAGLLASLASLASSSGLGLGLDLDLARDIDANLAQVDMEDFRSEDIHSVLSTLPAMRCADLQSASASASGGEMFASVSASGSLLARLELDSSSADSPRSCGSQGDESAGSTDTMSLCKSELLFSPVRECASECPLPGSNFSVDSLDCELLPEHDILLTCQANKDNYTIAFEGSAALYSEDSDCHEPEAEQCGEAWSGAGAAAGARALRFARARALDASTMAAMASMARSDSVYTTWSKLQQRSCDAQPPPPHLPAHRPADGDGPRDTGGGGAAGASAPTGAVKSQSLPNLARRRRRALLASMSGRLRPAACVAMSSSVESESRSPQTTVKLYDVQQSSSGLSETNSSLDASSSCGSASAGAGGGRRAAPSPAGALKYYEQQQQQQHFSLVKLFMKQKSQSSERMEQSSASEGCWPASASATASADSDSFAAGGGSGSGSAGVGVGALTPPPTPPAPQPPPPSPRSRRRPGPGMPFRDDSNGNGDGDAPTATDDQEQDAATNNWIRAEPEGLESTPGAELSASCLEDSLATFHPRPRNANHRLWHHSPSPITVTNDEDEEQEDEDGSEHSDSVEQLSESVSKIEESALDLGASSCGSSDPLSTSGPAPAQGPIRARLRSPSFNNNKNNHLAIATHNNNGSVEAEEEQRCAQSQATQTAAALMNRSVQTSMTTAQAPAQPQAQTQSQAPRIARLLAAKKNLYVLYPNYALPDLTFLREGKPQQQQEQQQPQRGDADAKVFLVPQAFRPAPAEKKPPPPAATAHAPRRPHPHAHHGRRPFSCTDIETLRRKGLAHVQDWESLALLLPRDCLRVLQELQGLQGVQELPELQAHLQAAAQMNEKPHFCVSPPPPPSAHAPANTYTPKTRRPRPASCGDCPADTGGPLDHKGVPTSSSSSSTATQPSSGYRGSSTMLLTDSSGGAPSVTAPTYNPLFVYRYDSVSSEASMMNTPAPPPKRSVSLPNGKKNHEKLTTSPPRPPLPRGILRQPEKIVAPSQTTIAAYNCKVHKNQTNSKRYSMFELGAKDGSLLEDGEYATILDNDTKMRLGHIGKPRVRAQTLGTVTDTREAAKRLAACLHPEKDIDEAEDEETDEGVDADVGDDISRGSAGDLIAPASPHLCCGAPPVAVVDELIDDGEDEEGEGAALSLEELLQVSALSALGPAAAAAAAATDGGPTGWDDVQMQRLRLQQPSGEDTDCHTPHNSPEHHASGCACGPAYKKSVSFAERAAASPLRDQELSPSSGSFGSIGSPTDLELAHQRGLVTAVAGAVDALVRLFSTTHDPVVAAPAAAELALMKLCPALYAVLGDGLKPRLDTPFGPIPNSVWQVVEATAQQGPMTQALGELVLRIQGEEVLSEGALRFNAFAFALLNARSLDAWLAFARTRERVLRRHYAAPGLLAAAAAGAPAARAALDRVVAALQPLALLPFRLDPLHEARRLHDGLRRLSQTQAQASPVPAAPAAAAPWTLRQLVRSIQSSLTASTEEEAPAPAPPPLPDLLASPAPRARPRPRSCTSAATANSGANAGGANAGFSLVTDIASTVRKRWSGIHLGSKLFQAFDRLAAEDSDEEYTDSLEPAPRPTTAGASDAPAAAPTPTPAPAVAPAAPTGSASPSLSPTHVPAPAVGGKFRRLQMKWEMLTGKETAGGSAPGSPARSPKSPKSPKSPGPDTVATTRSKIPRPVTSPVRPSGIPVPRAGSAPNAASPVAAASPAHAKRAGAAGAGPGQRASRVDAGRAGAGAGVVRPSSLSYRAPSGGGSAGRGANARNATAPARRAASSSQGRAKTGANGPRHAAPRFVRTLRHRLPADNGHLSFNEGERLKVVLEVDAEWLLCCRGDRKGLVPRSAVIDADAA